VKTERLYFFSDAFVATATVLQVTPSGVGGYVILDRTLFCAQSGGQPGDSGSIAGAQVTHVEVAKDFIIHTVSNVGGLTEGAEVDLRIDALRRQLHSRLHSGGHLLAALVEKIVPDARARGGYHWPGKGRVEFSFEGSLPADFESTVVAAIDHAITADISIKRFMTHEGARYVQIGEYPALRCSGTHCWHLKELGNLTLRGIKRKKNRLQIGYDVTNAPLYKYGY